jgi:hypothetical protein
MHTVGTLDTALWFFFSFIKIVYCAHTKMDWVDASVLNLRNKRLWRNNEERKNLCFFWGGILLRRTNK